MKEDERPVKSINDVQIRKLLVAAEPYATMKVRILLALGTDLRRGDIDSLKISDIDFEKNSANQTYVIVLSDTAATEYSFGGWVTNITLDVPLDDKVTMTVTISIDGQITQTS